MKKLILFLTLSLAVVSCNMLLEESNGRDNRMKEESSALVWNYLITPAYTLDYLLLVDRYLLASDEEKESDVFKDIREALYRGDDGSLLLKGLGILDTGGRSLREIGTTWKLEYKDGYGFMPYYYYYAKDIEGWSFEYVSDDLWRAVASDENVTAINLGDEGECTLAAFGERKTADGYDCSFKTEGEFTVANIQEALASDLVGIRGKFVHTVGRGSTVLETCEAVYNGGFGTVDFKLIK